MPRQYAQTSRSRIVCRQSSRIAGTNPIGTSHPSGPLSVRNQNARLRPKHGLYANNSRHQPTIRERRRGMMKNRSNRMLQAEASEDEL